MTPEELFAVWAPKQLIWSQWAIPVAFAQMSCAESPSESAATPDIATNAMLEAADSLAIVVDLPGVESIRFGLALAQGGFRPVPIIDGSPGPFLTPVNTPDLSRSTAKGEQIVVVDMSDLLGALCAGGTLLHTLTLPANAPPAFLLDFLRMSGERNMDKAAFDNRWKAIPQDFPSAGFLKQQGIRQVILVQKERGQPQVDLAEVLLGWQRSGLEILVADEGHMREAQAIRIREPWALRASWHRLLEILGLRRNSAAAFGAPSEGSSG